MTEHGEEKLSRREFIVRAAKTTAAAGAVLAGGAYFANRRPVPAAPEALTVRSFALPEAPRVFALARGKNPYELVRQAVAGAGGISRFVHKGEKVLIKVNCAFARPAWMGATSSPEVTGELIKMCVEAGAAEVRITDFPISDAKSCFAKSGLGQAAERAGGRVWLPEARHFAKVRVSDGVIGVWDTYIEPLRWADRVIGLPTAKSHNLSRVSLAMKNWYGFIGGSRSRFHQKIDEVIAELGRFITPTLIVLDATRLLVHNGPTGGSADDVQPGETVAVSTDPVAIDAFGAELLGIEKAEVGFIALAEKRGLGTSDYRSLMGDEEGGA